MDNRGKKVKDIIKNLGVNIKGLAPVLKKNERYVYELLDKPDLSWDIIRKIGNHIKYDFRKDFPDMPFEYNPLDDDDSRNLEEPLPLELEAKKWKDKYFKLLEDVSEMMREKKSEFQLA